MDQPIQSTNPVPVIAPETPPPSRNFVPVIIVTVVIAIFALLLTYSLMSSNQNKQSHISNLQGASPTQTLEKIPTPTSSDMKNWKIYNKLGVEFKYPSEATIEEDTNGNTQDTANFKIGTKEFTLERLKAVSENEAPYNQTKITMVINGVTWKVVTPEQTSEFCDAGDCSKTAPSYYFYKNGYQYSFTYYSDDLRGTIEDILSTFKFSN